jgi:hypothetical protein
MTELGALSLAGKWASSNLLPYHANVLVWWFRVLVSTSLLFLYRVLKFLKTAPCHH